MRSTFLYPIHPAIFRGTDPHRHYPSASLLRAYTDPYAIVGFFSAYGTPLDLIYAVPSQC